MWTKMTCQEKDFQWTYRTPAGNSTYPKVEVRWLNQALFFYQSSCLADSEVVLPLKTRYQN